ncbi:hypothetical protein PL11201_410048 [Planktothrix sp. PCC 11201]|nr:hypothetical protein PL11201_410048 [Planktothrix sp. PCC 11201]
MPYNPFQGLKPANSVRLQTLSLVEMPYNPFQGLKRANRSEFGFLDWR